MQIDWINITIIAMENFWQSFLFYLPNFILGILILVLGWFIADGTGKVVTQLLKKFKFDSFFEKEGWKEAMEKAKIKIHASKFVGIITKWIISIIFLWMAVGVLGLIYFAEFMEKIIRYIPNVIVASLIFVVAVIVADFLSKIIVVATQKAKFQHTVLAGEIAKWAIWIFATFAILIELEIARELLSILFTGIVAFMVIAGGLAFGLGGKDTAAEILENIKKGVKK